MSEEHKDRLLDETIIQAVRTMPEADVPDGFSARIMAELTPRKPSLWRRFMLWMTEPRALTYRRLQVIPAMTCAVALLALAYVSMDTPAQDSAPALSTVRFVLHDAEMTARKVAVIGSFNEWKSERSVMWYDDEHQSWVLEAQLPPGDHEYLFVVNDKKLIPDPQAQMTRDDGFGNKNSIIFVNGGHEQAL